MSWKLFLDDLRDPGPSAMDAVICRTSQEAIDEMAVRGCPEVIYFDHDLGGDDTSMVFINHLVEELLDGHVILPENFEYSVHSANPVGVRNIQGKMDGIIRVMRDDAPGIGLE